MEILVSYYHIGARIANAQGLKVGARIRTSQLQSDHRDHCQVVIGDTLDKFVASSPFRTYTFELSTTPRKEGFS